MSPTLTARVLAAALTYNGERLDRGEIDRAAWEAEQLRIWGLAAGACVASQVVRLVAPSLSRTAG